jgi:two-component system, LytTR family, response regulator
VNATHTAPIRALVVDDEPLSRSNVTALLQRHAEVEIVGECANGSESVEEIRRLKPDIVFLDVEMPECDGFDVLEMLGAGTPPAIVFVTAYDKYALQAFEAGALDYLLKPFDSVRFDRALERAKERVAYRRSAKRAPDMLAVKSVGGVTFLKIATIDWIEASDYYSRLHSGGKSYLIRRSMADLEDDLRPFSFCRIHRSAIVNLDRVAGMALSENGEYDVLLDDGTKLRLSRAHRRRLTDLLNARGI